MIGLTYLNPDDTVLKQVQPHGKVIQADDQKGIVIERADTGETFALPPGWDSIQKAPPGEYKLRSTGEVVKDPDYLTSWTINPPEKKKS